jgi:phage gp16-like protein
MSKLARDHRNAELAKIHLAKKDLCMTDEEYRAMLWSVGRVNSAKDLDYAGRQAVLQHLQACGFKPAAAKKAGRQKRPTPSTENLPLVRRIRAQLISLGKLPDEYADGIARQMLGADAPQFYEWAHTDALHRLSAALGVEQRRKGAPTR